MTRAIVGTKPIQLASKPKRAPLRAQLKQLVSSNHDRRGKPDRRRATLLHIGREMLEKEDYTRITIPAVVREANCSVGAFYTRFASKTHFIDALIAEAFHGALAELDPPDDQSKGQKAALSTSVRAIVSAVLKVGQQTPGALRAGLKRSQVAPGALAPVLAYRQAVTDQALQGLVPYVQGDAPEQAVRVAMQVLHATVTDASLHQETGLSVTSPVLLDQLVHMITQHLNRPPKRKI